MRHLLEDSSSPDRRRGARFAALALAVGFCLSWGALPARTEPPPETSPGAAGGREIVADLSRLSPVEAERAAAILAGLEASLPKMARRLGRPMEAEERALRLVALADFAEQARRLGVLGPAVVADGSLRVVFDPGDPRADLHLLRQAAARLLIRRAGYGLPPWIEEGASLWIAAPDDGTDADDEALWYGRPWRRWLPDLAAAGVLPTAGELLAGERQAASSEVLWAPVAAAFVDSLPGDDLDSKLREDDGGLLAYETARAAAERFLRRLHSLHSLDRPAAGAGSRHPASVRAAGAGADVFQRGISLAMANGLDIGYHAPALRGQLERLCALGSNAVSLMPFAYQPGPRTPELRFLNRHPASETDTGLAYAARRAREQGFRVLWKPHLWISHRSWPGDVEMESEDDWRRWFRAYRLYVLHHAVLAADAEAEWLSVGVELGRTLSREQEWRHLISAVRRVYPGRLTYAGNWHEGYERVPFWDALDAVGVDAYFPLAPAAEASRSEIEAGARRAVGRLARAAERWKKPVLLTEVGFAAHRGPWVAPHEEGGALSAVDQRLAWEIFLDALGRPPWLAGIYVWKVFTHPATEVPAAPDFQVLGRPAEAEIAQYFRHVDAPPRVLATPQ